MSLTDRIAALTPEQRALFEKLREQQRKAAARTHQPPPVRKVSGSTGEGDWPLSLDQERFWFMEQLHPGGAGLNITAATRMRGPFAVPVVSAALDEIVRRHAAWRTTFPSAENGPVQRVAATRRQHLAVIDLSGLPEARREPEALRLVGEDTAAPFDLERGPLMRASLVRVGERDHFCLLTVHHLVTDFISFQIVWGELAVLCEAFAAGRSPALPEPPVHYSDFAVWQREWLQGEVLEELETWWRERLAGFPLALELPTDRPRPAVLRMRGGQKRVAVSRQLSEGLRALGRQEGATLFMTVLATTAALLHRFAGQERLILGANNANRNRPEIAPVLGCFLTQVAFPIDVAGDPTFRELLARARQSALGAFAHQDLPFGKLVEAVHPERDTSRQPIVQALVQVLDGQPSKVELAGVSFEAVDAYDGGARYDLMLSLFDQPGGLNGSLEYDADLFDPATTTRLIEMFLLQAERAVADPDRRLSETLLLSEAGRAQVLREWNDTPWENGGEPLLHRLVQERAAAVPDAPAVLCAAGGSLTYGELAGRAGRLAHRLRRAGVGPEVRVGVAAGRSPELVVGMLAVLAAGGAYVPLDPDLPAERLAWMVADSGAVALLADERTVRSGPPETGVPVISLELGEDEDPPFWAEVDPDAAAYVIYTSGSTGLPKGVVVSHRSVSIHLRNMIALCGLGPGDRKLQFGALSFDATVDEVWCPLIVGGAVVFRSEEMAGSIHHLLQEVERLAVTVPSLPTAFWHEIAAALEKTGERLPPAVRLVIVGGEALQPGHLATWLRGGHPPVLNLYGPTETTVEATAVLLSDWREGEPISIGRPFGGARAYVVDPGFPQPAPPGVWGELLVGGPGVARGYLGRPDLTAERFVPDAWGGPGARVYRTGDRVRFGPRGLLEFGGRIDRQVKVRGFRVEPGEIEAALAEHPGLKDVAVVARKGPGGSDSLLACVVPADGEPSTAELRGFLGSRLPAHMVPAAFVVLPFLPLTPNGKVDRQALSRLAPDREQERDAGTPPATPAQEAMAALWREVLSLDETPLSLEDNFFELGGHSLLATRLVSRVRAAFGVDLPLRRLFEQPTLSGLAALVEAAAPTAPAPPAIPRRPSGLDPIPTSFAQERLWFLDRLAPGNAAYNIPLALAVHGELSLPAMAAALGEMVRRHEALRTRFEVRGNHPAQVIAAPTRWTLPLIDLSTLPDEACRREAWRLAGGEMARPFDLERDPVLRGQALRLGPDEHALLLVVHHIAADGWSAGVMVEEIAALYPAALAGTPSPLPELAVQYADFAVWQREWLQGETLDLQLGYWRERLADAPVLDLPTDRPRPPVQSFRGATRMRAIGPETARALETFARGHDATLFMVLLAAFQTLLGRYAGQEDLVVGSPIANRTRAELEPLIGFFVNTLALRGDLSGDPSFGEMVARSRRSALEAYSHQDLPFERLVEELNPERRLSHNPIFQVMFAVQNAPMRTFELPGLTFSPVEFDFPATRFDLEVYFTPVDGGLAAQLTWSTDLFDAPTVLRLADHLDALLAAVLAEPSRRLSEIPLLSPPERQQLLVEWNDTAAEIPGEDVADLFAEQARRRPGAVAVSAEDGELTYAELDRRAGRLARRLAAAGVGPEVRVALLAQRSPAMIVGLLGILKAGGAYVPLDPSYPAERLAWMLADSGARVLLGQPELLAELPDGVSLPAVVGLTADPEEAEGPEPRGLLPGGLAYVMYTSGSTGRPKGVGVTHRNIVRLVRESRFADLGADQVFLQLAPISFDASTLELWAPLLNGGRVAVFPPRRPSLEELGEAIARWGVTSLWLTAGLFHQMVEERLEALRPLRQLLAGGDVLSPPHVRRALDALPGLTLINGYGPTEGTTFTCCHPMTGADQVGPSVPIGRPIGNTRVHVLDPDLRPAPINVWGELFAGGEGLSRGYLGRPDLTAERFVPDPFAGSPGGRLYRTGDVVRFRPDGRVEFLGRRDGQVKIRGFRVELGEIESALARYPGVREAAVTARDDGGALGRRLVAYVVPRPAEAAPAADGSRHVEQWRELYEQTYAQGAPPEAGGDAAFNLQGWNSSYTGEPIPAGEMREWLDGTVGRLLALPHRRVLEVGCGTGLLLFRVAPDSERYRGTDFSAVALAQVQAEVRRRDLPQVELAQGLADDWTGVSRGELELVVLNSVVQYFPGVDYLVRVLEGAVAAVPPGGAVFVGDVRSLPLLEAFHASVQLHQASGSLPVAELARRVRRRAADEEELVVDPALFLALAHRVPGVRRVQVLIKRGRHANELTRFRYDVVLHVGEREKRTPPAETLLWKGDMTLGGLERRLAEEAPDLLTVTGLPNARLAAEAAVLELLDGAGREMETVEELRAGVERLVRERGGVDPEDVWTLADRLGYEADLTWPADGGVAGRFDAVLRRRGAGIPAGWPAGSLPEENLPWSAWANDPLRADQARRLAPELRRFLESELPEHMVPSAFVLLDALPLTANGKVDRAALPAPDRFGEPAEDWVAPATPLEELLARNAAEVLGLDRVGMRDNFFDLGGHSLLATQLVSRLTQDHGIQVTLQMVFDSPTLGELADRIVERELESAGDELLEEMLREMEGQVR